MREYRPVAELRKHGAGKVFREVASGAKTDRANARGVKPGRKPKLTDHQKREAIKRRDQGDETLADIARSYNVSLATISRLAE
jgi:hypothetical protein